MMNKGVNDGCDRGPGPGLNFESSANEVLIPEVMNLLPMAELNSFPSIVSTVRVDEAVGRRALRMSYQEDRFLALFALKHFDVDPENLLAKDFWPVGVAVEILEIEDKEDQYLKASVKGLRRVFLDECFGGEIPKVKVRPSPFATWDETLSPLIMEARRLFADVLSLIPGRPVDLFKINRLLEEEPEVLADLIMSSLPLKPAAKTEFLSISGLTERYHKLLEHLNRELADRLTGRAISQRVEESLTRQDRDRRLREQIKAIQIELGEVEAHEDLVKVEEKVKAQNLPLEAREAAERELRRLKMTPPQSAEYGVTRGFLEWLVDLPWDKSSAPDNDLQKARAILERDHHGLDQAKNRILEFLAVHRLTPNHRGTILCLTGPPGVGKTSLGRSIAAALGRKFVRLSLGGVKDEAEIRGHRRTYVGARPGRIIAALQKSGVNNPVFLLDEIDKMTISSQGDPGAALLEALDYEQNETFTDHYLELPFDLSKIIFILTANVLDRIPPPLRDRLEVVEVSGYITAEKMAIARDHLWPQELARHGLSDSNLAIEDAALTEIIESYTSEAGCRDLSRRLRAIIRNRAMKKAEGQPLDLLVKASELKAILGAPKYAKETRGFKPQVGVATGLAWTVAGGELMYVEAVAMPGEGHLSLTGRLGEVMRESAQAAISYARSKAKDWNLDPDWFRNRDVHIHLPHGAIPKDGPSAGVSLAVALISLLSGRPIRPDLGLTGEITLRGLVLPVGGLKEKILAAKRAGLTTVLVPAKNLPEIEELPAHLLLGLEIKPIANVDEAINAAIIGGEALTAPLTKGDSWGKNGEPQRAQLTVSVLR
ncbi:MAG: endopeptidase La [Deltaproteobacteria bacterium]|jgi:ATP-dependent Lon protease|nr:endopeptidase La [Deltaproteobacteria bacterium]